MLTDAFTLVDDERSALRSWLGCSAVLVELAPDRDCCAWLLLVEEGFAVCAREFEDGVV
jgi:hypothetical protein